MAARLATYRAPARARAEAPGPLLALEDPGQALGPLAQERPAAAPSPLCAAYADQALSRACPAPGFLLDRYVY